MKMNYPWLFLLSFIVSMSYAQEPAAQDPAAQKPGAQKPAAQEQGAQEQADKIPEVEYLSRDLNGYFPFDPPRTIEQWNQRREELRKHVLVAQGLWPLPPKPELKPVIHGLIEKPGYTIEKVYFESLPGFFVTGNLYRPAVINGKVPGVLCPHGHFPKGRFGKRDDQTIQKDIDSGAETFRSNAANKIQARSANLARMGCVVFVYDMIGYADSQQISFEVADRFKKQRPEMNNPDTWGLFSPQAESNFQSVMGLQTWNSIRALDFVSSLPDVDPKRIGVTGGSGGGTQTFMLCAVDDRPAAAMPCVMVSTAMQGGCTCENCSLLRIGTGNVELAALFAPKPMGLTAADDWTKEMETKGFPELKKLYELYGKPDNVELTARLEFKHNYNQVSREAMYRLFKKHLGFAGEPIETEIEYLEPEVLTVFDEEHPRPPGGLEFEKQFMKRNKIASDKQLADQLKLDFQLSNLFDDLIGTYVEVVNNAALTSQGRLQVVHNKTIDGQHSIEEIKLTDAQDQEYILWNVAAPSAKANVLLLSSDGQSVLEKDHPHYELGQQLLAKQWSVSQFINGTISEPETTQIRLVSNPREALCYTLGYNPPQLALRAAAWQQAIETVNNDPTFVVALDRSALEFAVNAKALSELDHIKGFVVDTEGFRFQNITDFRDPDLLPGASKYLDVPGLLSLAAPKPMLVFGENAKSAQITLRGYQVAGVEPDLQFAERPDDHRARNQLIVDWIERNQ